MDADLPVPIETPSTALDALRAHPDWDDDRREEAFLRLVSKFEPSALKAEARARLDRLDGADAPAVVRLLGTFGGPDDLRVLADAIESDADLAPEIAYEGLALLDAAGLLDGRLLLQELWNDLQEWAEESDSAATELAEQLEEGPDAVWVALQALGAIPPADRRPLVAELAPGDHAGPGLAEFLRCLALGFEPGTARAAAEVLARLESGPLGLGPFLPALAARHPDLWTSHLSSIRLEAIGGPIGSDSLESSDLTCLATGVDHLGRGRIVVASRPNSGAGWDLAEFACDMERGVVQVDGELGAGSRSVDAALAGVAGAPGAFAATDDPEAVLGLLAGSMLLCGPDAPPELTFWLARVAGPEFGPRPWAAPGRVENTPPPGGDAARIVLEACPTWFDDSALSRDLAREAILRGESPDDWQGAIRVLFERRLRDRVELYRRMVLWMAVVWEGAGASRLASAARETVAELSDVQNLVPGHGFFRELAARSLRKGADIFERESFQ